MFQIKARRIVPVLALTAALTLFPLASASADTAEASDALALLAQIEEKIVSIWNALREPWTNVGPRMDDNG